MSAALNREKHTGEMRKCGYEDCPTPGKHFPVPFRNVDKMYCNTSCCNKGMKRPSRHHNVSRRFVGIRGSRGIAI